MTAPTWADPTLPLAERVALAMLDWDMGDAHQAHRRELVADVAAALGGRVVWADAQEVQP